MKTAADILAEKGNKIISVGSDATIHEALSVMMEHRIGAILVREGDEVVGIWTERDLMKNTLTPGFDPKTAKISDYMTTNLQYVPDSATCLSLLDKFLGMRLRHLLIEKEGVLVGLLSTGDVIKANLVEKTNEVRELTSIVSWEYYENWRWKKE